LANRALVCAVAALVACAAPGTCGTLRVDLGFGPAAVARASGRAASNTRQAVDRIAVEGFCSSVSSGNPALPCRLIYVALPPDADERSVSAAAGSYTTTTLPGSYDVAPVPAIAVSDAEEGTVHQTAGFPGQGMLRGKPPPEAYLLSGRNALVYGRDEFYPRDHVRVAAVGRLRSWKVAILEFWPYSYNPATGRLRMVTSTQAMLSFGRETDASAFPDPVAAAMSGFVENRAEAEGWYGAAASASPRGYVIITTTAIASASAALADFASFQGARGYSVRIVTEGDWGGGTGNAAAENIRAWLVLNYGSLAIQYVLLIGNPDPAAGNVPMKMLWPRRWASSYKDAPSDYYYSDLTGNWDLDGDGYAGEEPDDFGTGGIDRIPEVYVGRIPFYGSVGKLDSILRKTMAYESGSPGQWARTFLLPMVAMDSDTLSYQLGEQITSSFVGPLGLTPDRVYDYSYGLDPAPEHFPCSYDLVQNEWAKGAGLVFWMTHGSSNTAGNVFSSLRCAYLDDSKPSIVYMASCLNGKPEDSSNLGYCVLARGGVTTLSASRVSWYYLRERDFSRTDSIGGLGYQYARFVLGACEPCGKAAMDARLANPVGIWPNHLVYNLYGDPSLAYRLPKAAEAVASIAAAKSKPDGDWVVVSGVVVSRLGQTAECFVQDANRCAGMQVSCESAVAPNLQPGSTVTVTGCLATVNGMRVLANADISPTGSSAPPSPLGMSSRAVADGKTFGLLVSVWGRVLSASASAFTISGGIPVVCHNSASPPPVGSFARVVGISTPEGVGVYGAGDVGY